MQHGKSMLVLENGLLLGGLYWLLRKQLAASVFMPSAVLARHPDDLNKGIPASYDGAHPFESKTAFEWWYFDARFTDGHTFAGTITDPDVFGNNWETTQVYFHINTPAGDVLDVRANHPRDRFSAATDICDVNCAGSSIKGSYPEWKIDLEGDGIEVHLQFQSLLPGWARGNGEMVFGAHRPPDIFGWVVAQPRAKVSGTLSYGGREFKVEGVGYHDHNWGNFNLPMKVSRWHWGRITTPEITIVFVDVLTNRLFGGAHFPLIMIARGDRLAFETFDAEWEFNDYAMDPTGMQTYPHHAVFNFAERDVSGMIEFYHREELEIRDLFEQMNVPVRARGPIARFLAQPCYYRFLSEYEGEIDFGGDIVAISGETITEYVDFNRRRGSVPRENGYAHFLNP